MYDCTEDRFLSDIPEHQMTIIRDDGVNRTIRFGRPGSSCYYFDILTWPGKLCISGDMGTWVFQRVTDMFKFFRPPERHAGPQLYINASYWAEKLANGTNGGHAAAVEWSEEKFRESVKDRFDSHYRDNMPEDGEDDKEAERRQREMADVWDKIEDEILRCEDRHEMQRAAYEFSHEGFSLRDEVPSGEVYIFQFIWCLYAIVWAIRQYDASRVTVAADARAEYAAGA